jgi:hypothetical protein
MKNRTQICRDTSFAKPTGYSEIVEGFIVEQQPLLENHHQNSKESTPSILTFAS